VRALGRAVGLAAMVVVTLTAAAALAVAPTHAPRDPATGSTSSPGSGPTPSRVAGTSQVSEYVALGDSYTAGPFIPQLVPALGCFRSTRNYPALLAAALDVETFTDVSCSGADTADLTAPQHTGFATVPAQLRSLSADTDLVTLGIGGNDFGLFGRLVSACPRLRPSDPGGAPCRAYFATETAGSPPSSMSPIGDRVGDALTAIGRRAPRARVLVVGYPRIAPPRGTCTGVLPFAAGDYAFATRVQRRLNAALRQAASTHGAEYVDTYAASRGHDACAGEQAWVNGRYTDPNRAQSFHPFGSYMRAAARLVQRQLTH
jgi:lysophospholipase L1-like esterase